MKRTKHSLSHYKLLSFSPGELVPVSCYEVLPGDSIQHATSALLRVSPLVRPVMHPVTVRLHSWFVPYRLVWEDWEEFITGGSDGEGDGSVYPTVSSGGAGYAVGSLADYLGIPPSVANLSVSALPFRAYSMIFNEYYRDQDLTTERVIDITSGADTTTDVSLATIAWEKDYFTSARPWPQKGPDVVLPLGTSAPVQPAGGILQVTRAGDATLRNVQINTAGNIQWAVAPGDGLALNATSTNLLADLSGATAATVNAVREAFALQRYQEARALFGSRYTEYLRYLGVRSSDARLQRPEYLGGGKQTIAFSEVVATTDDGGTQPLGDLGGHGIAAMRSRRYRRFFEEHGVCITLMSIRPRTMYMEMLPRMWSRVAKEDFYQKELEAIGQQEVYRREIFAQSDAAGGDTVFGYQNRYAEYRHEQSSVAGEFRTTFDDWHMARSFGAAPTLNNSFVSCDPTTRIYADQTAADKIWAMVSHSVQARRMVSRTSIGRIY